MGGLLHEQTTPAAPLRPCGGGKTTASLKAAMRSPRPWRAGVAIDKIFLMKGDTDPTLGHIASAAREKGIVVVDADRRKLDA